MHPNWVLEGVDEVAALGEETWKVTQSFRSDSVTGGDDHLRVETITCLRDHREGSGDAVMQRAERRVNQPAAVEPFPGERDRGIACREPEWSDETNLVRQLRSGELERLRLLADLQPARPRVRDPPG